ncbi:hypothetical protein AURDEDRAFT_123681 [Auricularia subglabra TFB-10046 SS5]|nr:hypothetical protein AURDEDRAFT_123681 [Auricularia subglabra TFB-10046 SS5]
MAPISRLPFELLCTCLTGFSLDDLLPLRLVCKTWLSAVNVQDAYSRDIDYWDPEASSRYNVFETPHQSISLDLLQARLSCSSREVRLRICTLCLPDDITEAIVALISEHLERMEVLWISFLAGLSGSVFEALLRHAPRLRDLYLDVAHLRRIHRSFDREYESDSDSLVSFADIFDEPDSSAVGDGSEPSDQPELDSGTLSNQLLSPVSEDLDGGPWQPGSVVQSAQPRRAPETRCALQVPSTIFEGHAPALQTLSLSSCALAPLGTYPAFSHVRYLALCSNSQSCVSPEHMLTVAPQLDSLDITAMSGSSYQPSPTTGNKVVVPPLRSVRVDVRAKQTLAMLDMFTSVATPVVTMSTMEQASVLALFTQLRNRGPFTFEIYTDHRRDFLWMYMQLVSTSSGHVRGFEIHEYDHWLWDWDEPCLLQFFENCSLASDITTIHVRHRKEGQ